jgi:hypothetical protein
MSKKANKKLGEATRASVEKEMAKPRMAESAREAEVHQAAVRKMPVKRRKAK